MIEAARDAVRRITGGSLTPSGLLMREALEAALDAAPAAEPLGAPAHIPKEVRK
jgi:hypothetical protein